MHNEAFAGPFLIKRRMIVKKVHYIETEKNIRLYCEEYGAGKPVLMVHGACVDGSYFRDAAEILAKKYHVFIYDRRGSGKSLQNENADYSLEAQAQDLICMIQKIQEKTQMECMVVASSAGCIVTSMATSMSPELFHRIIMHEPANLDVLDADDPMLETIAEDTKLLEQGLYSLPLYNILSCEQLQDSRVKNETDHMITDENAEHFICHEYEWVRNSRIDYSRLKTLQIWIGLGELSHQTYHVRNCPRLAELLGAEVIAFPGGHNCAWNLPVEFAAIITGIMELYP